MQRFLPLALFAVLLALLGAGLTLKPSELPSTLIDKPAPAFRLPLLDNPARHMDVAALQGQVWLLNVWASWCVSCRAEHETLMRAGGFRLERVVSTGDPVSVLVGIAE